MTNLTPSRYTIGYCTNVHAGVDLDTIRENLSEYAVRARVASGSDELGVGLWLPSPAAAELSRGTADFKSFLRQRQLRPYTINGFPYDNFHQDVVKHRVYRPTWCQEERMRYTQQLAVVLAELLPDDEPVGSISTLPIGWPDESSSQSDLEQAGRQFRRLAGFLRDLESKSGRQIVVAIEPEPGCILDSTDDVLRFFANQLPETLHRRYITVCHDVCHSAVMMEPQAEVLQRLAAAEITVGKVQVSSAVVANWDAMASDRRPAAIEQLREFAEDRYLHQTGRKTESGQFVLAEDLPQLLPTDGDGTDPIGGDVRWVVHFHVPIFLQQFGDLSTSRADVLECLRTLEDPEMAIDFTGHLEIETYAWTVLPPRMRKRSLSDDIASEVTWLREALAGELAP